MTDAVNEMESMLGRYRPASADAALRGRIVRQSRRRSRWVFCEALAAMLLIGMNLAQISATVTQFISRPHPDENRTQEIAAGIAQLDLPLSNNETQAMAVQLAAGQRLTMLPVLHGAPIMDHNYGVIP